MPTKKKLLSTLKDLPEKFSGEELMDRVVLLQKIEIGLEQAKAGKTHSTKEARVKLKKWL